MKRNNILEKIFDFIFPFFSVWIIIGYIRFCNYVVSKNKNFGLLCFLFIIFLEIFFTKIFKKYNNLKFIFKIKNFILIFFRLIFWLILYYVWAIYPNYTKNEHIKLWFEFFNFSLVPMVGIVIIAQYIVFYILIFFWLLIYSFITVKNKVFRITTSFFLPLFIIFLLFYDYYFFGGLGRIPNKEIESQKGVKFFFTKEDFKTYNIKDYILWLKELQSTPREIFLDKKYGAIFVNYASTYGKSSGIISPTIFKIDLITKDVIYFKSYYVRSFFSYKDSIIFVPWFEKKIYEISKKDLSLKKVIPIDLDLYPLEILNIYTDGEYIYLFNDMRAAVLKFDYKNSKLLNYIIPKNVKYGGCIWCPQFYLDKIYVVVFGDKYDLWIIDANNLSLVKKVDIFLYSGSFLLIDEENKSLYYQDGGSNKLVELDLENLNIKRILKGEVHSRSICLDKKRGCLYILSYFYGRLTVLDLKTGKHLFKILVGAKPYSMYFDKENDFLYVNSLNGILKIDLKEVWSSHLKNNS